MLTVMFATFNGADSLETTLDAMSGLTAPPGGWKLVIIDNASSDHSAKIINRYLDRLPLSFLSEAKRGKNAALNTGLAAIEGDLVVFTDDDVIPATDWLLKLRAAADQQTGFDIFGGKILPHWTRKPAPWLLDWVNHQIVYALTPTKLESGEISAGNVWGPNMAVRTRVFEAGFSFDTSVGPDGTANYRMGSETSFTGTLEKHGYRSWFVPEAVVQHIISEREMDYGWVVGRAVRFGRGAFLSHLDPLSPPPPLVSGMPRYLIRRYLEGQLRLMASRIKRDEESVFEAKWNINETKGMLIEARSYYSRPIASDIDPTRV